MINKILFLLFLTSSLFSSGSGGSWFESWLYPDTGLFFWSVITFLIVFVILRWKAWGPLMQALDDREAQIRDSLNKAEKITQEQEKSTQKNEAILTQAREEAKDIVIQAKEAGEKLKLKLEENGRTKYDEFLSNATAQIETEKQKALNDVKKMVIEIAISASEKVIKRNLNNEDNKKMIQNTVDSFNQKN